MYTKRQQKKKNRTQKIRGGKKSKSKTGKKWVTAIAAASKTLEKTKSITAAKKSLQKQALYNARKLFGAVGTL